MTTARAQQDAPPLDEVFAYMLEVGHELGDRRRIRRAAQYVDALLTRSRSPKTFAELARLQAGGDADERELYRVEQSFQHLVNGSSWQPDALIRPTAERISAQMNVIAWMLVAVRFPRLGEHQIHYPERREGRHQIAAVAQLVGTDAAGRPAVLPARWALSLESPDWTHDETRRRRAGVDYPVGVHISMHGMDHLNVMEGWRVPRRPIVAGNSYERLRLLWLKQERRRYVVQLPDTSVLDSPDHLQVHLAIARFDNPQLEMLREHRYGDAVWEIHSLGGELGEERVLVARDDRQPTAWCTNMVAEVDDDPGSVIELARLRSGLEYVWDDFRYGDAERLGLGAAHYRGSFVPGWHRHCALVTAAQGFNLERRLGEARAPRGHRRRRFSVASSSSTSDVPL